MVDRPSIRTVDRLVDVLDRFTKDRPIWSLSELSAQLGLPKSTLHRFLVGLEGHGILRRGRSDGKWRLGHHLLIWGSLAAESTGVRHIAAPVMRDLAEQTGETVILTEYHGGAVICIDKVETSHSVRIAFDIGARRALHAGASSKVLMAYMPETQVADIIREEGLPRYCERTITDPAELRQELARIRECGYAFSYEETDRGAWGIATPIRNWEDQVIAAIGIAGPTVRFSSIQDSPPSEQARRYVNLCREAAEQISGLLGRDVKMRR
jgi:IclR family KDG regulon transcriptional repressor